MMIAIVRKNLSFILSKHNSFACKSPVSSALHLSTWRERQNVIYPKVYDLLFLKHHFPPDLASLVASDLALLKSPENAESILSFLKESGCSTTQLHKIVKYDPRILSHSLEDIQLKIKIFKDLGLAPQDTVKMISINPVIFHLSTKNNIIPSLSLLKGLLGSDYDVARLLRKSSWPLSYNLRNTLLPNVEFLKSIWVPMERIHYYLYFNPRFLLIKQDAMRKSVEKAKVMGFSESSKMFIYALINIAFMSKGMWEVKLQSFQEMGFSESDTLTMFKKHPGVFTASMKKIEKINQLLLATGKFNMSSIVEFPASFGYSIEQRLEPRLRILQILESNNLIEKWPGLSNVCSMSADKFFERFVKPYPSEVGKAFCVKDKS